MTLYHETAFVFQLAMAWHGNCNDSSLFRYKHAFIEQTTYKDNVQYKITQ